MKTDRSFIGWALAGAIVLGTIVAAILHVQPRQSLIEQFATEATKLDHFDQLRLALASATEAEKSAVLAITDEDSLAFANRARAATATAERHRLALEQLLRDGGDAKEREALASFSTVFLELQRIDRDLLELAARNSNIKATALAFGPYAESVVTVDAALSRLVAAQARSPSTTAKHGMLLAGSAQAAELRIQALLPQHIAEQSDPKMDALEARIHAEDQAIGKQLDALDALLHDDPDLAVAKAGHAKLGQLRAQIIKLSRENTNVRSLSISMNEKRKITMKCEDALGVLGQAIEEARREGPSRAPGRAR